MALVEIDGLPNLKMVDLSMAMLNSQRICFFVCVFPLLFFGVFIKILVGEVAPGDELEVSSHSSH